ncbi:MAG TPA: hypothetical protein DCY79_23990 [Planctomycetaceae bacterium]|nr:hypothetical protein [Blastopirellula sp.]HAY82882.1 hypothetical protein [Planctomycetaceae bacterium]|tara:strand:- start:64 stop:579 length:516 start_codon:yes stop_codon:yes gene_type:complete
MDKFFELIVGEHRHTVFGLLFSLVRDRDLAEDLTQETFVVLFRKIDGIDVSQPILPWLLATARNLAANAQRRRKLEQSVILRGQTAVEVWAQLGDSTLGSEWSERLLALGECRENLSESQKSAVELFYDRGYDCERIATALDAAAAAIHNRLTRARKALYECIQHKLRSVK